MEIIGAKVKHAKFGEGVIVAVCDESIDVDFNGVVKTMALGVFTEKLTIEDEKVRALISEMSQKIKDEEASKKAAEEAEIKAAIEAAKKAALINELNNNKTKAQKKAESKRVHIAERRSGSKRVVFLVCQNDNFESEARGGFIWAPNDTCASHVELDFVQEGDLVFHHFGNKIHAISIAKTGCYQNKVAEVDNTNYGKTGRCVDLDYHIISNPADTTALKAEKAKYGSATYAPFEVTGKNKQGFYLSELNEQLAILFIDAAITANPSDVELVALKSMIYEVQQ